MKRVKIKTPSGKVRIHQKMDKASAPKCAECKKPLHGMKKLNRSQIRKLSKSDKRPEKPYGGYLCSNCSRELFREKVRSLIG